MTSTTPLDVDRTSRTHLALERARDLDVVIFDKVTMSINDRPPFRLIFYVAVAAGTLTPVRKRLNPSGGKDMASRKNLPVDTGHVRANPVLTSLSEPGDARSKSAPADRSASPRLREAVAESRRPPAKFGNIVPGVFAPVLAKHSKSAKSLESILNASRSRTRKR